MTNSHEANRQGDPSGNDKPTKKPAPSGRAKLHTDLERYLIEERLKNHRNDYLHPSYELEQQLLAAIHEGRDIEAVSLLDKINAIDRADLSTDPIRSLKNSLIGSATIFTRAAIRGGVDAETAFMLSDLFIRQVEKVSSRQQAESLEYDMLIAFIDAVKNSKTIQDEEDYSPVITRVRQYIRQNVNQQISLADAAASVNVHPNYLSTLFTKECGLSLMAYYDKERVTAISQHLRLSDEPLADIAMNFSFHSFSHFSSYFKRHTGMSPREYRKEFREY